MKNAIYYYYQLTSYNITQIEGNFYFKSGNFNYYFTLVENVDLKTKYDLSVNFLNYGIPCHQIILNKDQNIITNINSKNYVLMRLFVEYNKKIEIEDIFQFQNKLSLYKIIEVSKKNNWKQLWINKIDYFEYQITQFGKKFPIIRESFSYYIGLGENAIDVLNNLTNDEIIFLTSHSRIHNNDTLLNLYNPLNFINDSRVRDIVEYVKDEIFNSNMSYELVVEQLKKYISNSNLTYTEFYLLFARLLYPSYYFDLYEDIVLDLKEESEINNILNKTSEFERFLRDIYTYISAFVTMPEIEWIKKI